jgi:hypothetical protein
MCGCGANHDLGSLKAEISRRAVLVGALAAGAGAVLAGAAGPGAGPALAQRDPVLDGVIDLHVHADPDVDARSIDDAGAAAAYAQAGARAVLLKNHYLVTADRAYIARNVSPGIEVFGGVTLNKQVGGMNAAAVQMMARIKGRYGKVVWFPTRDSENNLRRFPRNDAAVRVVDEGGELLPETREVLKVIAGENLAVFTGHLSPAEALTVFREAKALGITKMMATHALADPNRFTIDQMKEAASLGALIEHVYLASLAGPTALSPGQRDFVNVPIEQFAESIRAVGAENCVLSTDLGQAENVIHPIGFKAFIMELMQAGISQPEVDLMARANPARLLDLA